jgi:hypothetical protein
MQKEETFSVYLEPGSGLIFEKDLYNEWLHGIEELFSDII